MEIRVSGHQVDTGEALREHVRERMSAIADKYFARAIFANVTFSKGPHDHSFCCNIFAQVMQGVILKATGEAADAHPAFDQAADKIEKQLRRYMRRLKDRNNGAQQADAAGLDAIDANAGYTVFGAAAFEEEAPDNPPIIAETKVDIPDATVSDAVMLLDLRHTNALMFRNTGTGAFNMVYRREDGTIGWVEPQRS